MQIRLRESPAGPDALGSEVFKEFENLFIDSLLAMYDHLICIKELSHSLRDTNMSLFLKEKTRRTVGPRSVSDFSALVV